MNNRKLLIWGISGTMGEKIAALAEEDNFWEIMQGVDSKTDIETLGKDYDVMIDFSHPSVLDQLLSFGLENRIPIVIGTTGYSEKQEEQIREAGETIPILKASNTSLGMNLLFSLVKETAKAIGQQVDIEVVEAHHRRKKDAPSGSAKTLVASIEEGLGESRKTVYGREGESPRERGEIGVHALRGGDIKGVHHVHFIDDLEQITLSHEAMDRRVFASGALKAAKFMIGKSPGLYGMADVLRDRNRE